MITYLKDTDAVEKRTASAWVPVNTDSGRVLQVVQTVKTDTYGVSLAQGASDTSDVSGLTVSITPSSVSNKILVMCQVGLGGEQAVGYSLFRNGSVTGYIGNADGSRTRVSASATPTERGAAESSLIYLDSPATTSAVTYSIRLTSSGTGTTAVYVNRSLGDGNDNRVSRSASSIIAMEIKA
jgi:hypothetical protein